MASAQLNLHWFLVFRVFFNARFYYPVFTILFLDYGLTLDQFAILNVVWAITIVLAEVPSGALADLIGRTNLLRIAAALMCVEMALLAFAPIGLSSVLFAMLLVNRICSGLAEAAASGADEALAYDSLKSLGREQDWPKILERTAHATSVAFFSTMLIGALAYDHVTLNALLQPLGLEIASTTAMRLPVFFTLATSLLVLLAALNFKEVPASDASSPAAASTDTSHFLLRPFVQILEAARWTLGHRFVLLVILAALALDSVARQMIILASEYYRLIGIPTFGFGLIGACSALLGVLYARLARRMLEALAPNTIFWMLCAILLTGLLGMRFLLPWIGVLFALMTFSMLPFVAFFTSAFINREVPSRMRATVLSFRGLALNLALGTASLLYSGWIAALRASTPAAATDTNLLFRLSLNAFPVYLACLVIALFFIARWLKPKSLPETGHRLP